STADGAKNAVACRGQQLEIPAGDNSRLYLLWASSDGDVQSEVQIDGNAIPVRVGQWTGYVGQWDHRVWKGEIPEQAFGWTNALAGLEPGYIKPDCIAWFCSHHHTADGDAFYRYCYLFKTGIDLPSGAKTLRLPDDERIK